MKEKKFSYQELLKDPRWIKRRNEILTRDRNTCQLCGAQDRYLHVHHLKYIVGHKPWEYQDEDLVTLCDSCHNFVHSNTPITDIRVGDLFGWIHSDWYMNYLVYDVDYLRGDVYVIGCDNGASLDTVYDETRKASFLREKCNRIIEPRFLNYLFKDWFDYVIRNISIMPKTFQYNLNTILANNDLLMELKNTLDKER